MKDWVIICSLVLAAIVAFLVFSNITAFSVFEGGPPSGGSGPQGPPANAGEVPSFGPSESEISCMKSCVTGKCGSLANAACNTENGPACQIQCNVVKPEQTDEEKCVEACALEGCEKYDFTCQKANQAKCDKQCGMIKAPDESTMSEEQRCISVCINKVSPGTICGASKEGETGGAICQECAKQCEHLYAGPCLDDEKLSMAKKECETCPHCYGEPVMGDSGEGWECIVDVACKDATAEWGDEPGEGAGVIAKAWDTIVDDNLIRIKDFFSGEPQPSD